jgi:hypothetical protein
LPPRHLRAPADGETYESDLPSAGLRRHTGFEEQLAGVSRAAPQTRLGHADFKTTRIYINAAGGLFPEDTELLEARVFGQMVGHNGASPP